SHEACKHEKENQREEVVEENDRLVAKGELQIHFDEGQIAFHLCNGQRKRPQSDADERRLTPMLGSGFVLTETHERALYKFAAGRPAILGVTGCAAGNDE